MSGLKLQATLRANPHLAELVRRIRLVCEPGLGALDSTLLIEPLALAAMIAVTVSIDDLVLDSIGPYFTPLGESILVLRPTLRSLQLNTGGTWVQLESWLCAKILCGLPSLRYLSVGSGFIVVEEDSDVKPLCRLVDLHFTEPFSSSSFQSTFDFITHSSHSSLRQLHLCGPQAAVFAHRDPTPPTLGSFHLLTEILYIIGTVPEIGDDGDDVLLEERLQTEQAHLGYLEAQLRSAPSSVRRFELRDGPDPLTKDTVNGGAVLQVLPKFADQTEIMLANLTLATTASFLAGSLLPSQVDLRILWTRLGVWSVDIPRPDELDSMVQCCKHKKMVFSWRRMIDILLQLVHTMGALPVKLCRQIWDTLAEQHHDISLILSKSAYDSRKNCFTPVAFDFGTGEKSFTVTLPSHSPDSVDPVPREFSIKICHAATIDFSALEKWTAKTPEGASLSDQVAVALQVCQSITHLN
ncbi:hypothetical protein P7C70_g5850, partial [Phenoliferia sp. Uapishka_3]